MQFGAELFAYSHKETEITLKCEGPQSQLSPQMPI